MVEKKKSRVRFPIHGVLLLDKPLGLSSNQALQKAKYLLRAQKAGHTGALDPLASGVLPLCFGEATKFSQFLLDSDKRYQATFRLGLETESGDMDAPVVVDQDASHITLEQIENAIENFRGCIEQVPPMFSALKHQGQPLYKLARSGVEIERKPRSVEIYEYGLLNFRSGPQPEIDVDVFCSKGTYIRSLALDLGFALGVGATVTQLRRTQAGPYFLDQCVTLEQLQEWLPDDQSEELSKEALWQMFSAKSDELLAPVDSPVASLPSVIIPAESEKYFSHGNSVFSADFSELAVAKDVRVFSAEGAFLGLGAITEGSRVQPKRLVVID